MIKFLCLLCLSISSIQTHAFEWNSANLYLILPDRFYNADPSNDFGKTQAGHPAWKFTGGDLQGITTKIQEGYFTNLGVNVLWIAPIQKQVHGGDHRKAYAYHGYWISDWTEIDPHFGTEADLKKLVEEAHKRGIKILLDAVLNHAGPPTSDDPSLNDPEWIRPPKPCTYTSYKDYVECSLCGLPDILTEKTTSVSLPDYWRRKWMQQGRYEKEMAELENFFQKTGLPKTPVAYIMKWLSDPIRKYGIDGFRIDTVKHVEPEIWPIFKKICQSALEEYRKSNPHITPPNPTPFFFLGEVYGFSPQANPTNPLINKYYQFPDKSINYFNYGFDGLINFAFASEAHKSYKNLFEVCNNWIQKDFKGNTLANYLRSHDDSQPFDPKNTNPYQAATKLLLSPGLSQIYYGQEIARPLQHNIYPNQEFTDANLRSPMNWQDLALPETQALLTHYNKLGQFRIKNPAVGAGKQTILQSEPLVIHRVYQKGLYKNHVVIALDLPPGKNRIPLGDDFPKDLPTKDFYSGLPVNIQTEPGSRRPFIEIDFHHSLALIAPDTQNKP